MVVAEKENSLHELVKGIKVSRRSALTYPNVAGGAGRKENVRGGAEFTALNLQIARITLQHGQHSRKCGTTTSLWLSHGPKTFHWIKTNVGIVISSFPVAYCPVYPLTLFWVMTRGGNTSTDSESQKTIHFT